MALASIRRAATAAPQMESVFKCSFSFISTKRYYSSTPVVQTTTQVQQPARILVTGCLGQIGTELIQELRDRGHYVVGTDIKKPEGPPSTIGQFQYADVTDYQQLASIVVNHRIDWMIHNAAILSGAGEKNPQLAMNLNINGLHNALEIARVHNLRLFVPSSIAAFGPTTPLDNTPDVTIQRPTTIYGISKVYAEHMGEYYHQRYNVDFRSLRYPGVISYKTLPGGGTTDYSVHMYYHAVRHYVRNEGENPSPPPSFECFLSEQTRLPMMYMPDCIRATISLLEADESKLQQRTYNVNAMSFTPEEEVEAIRNHFPDFKVHYQPDFRQKIADSWPKKLEDSAARKDWGWSPQFDLEAMTRHMISQLTIAKKSNNPYLN